MHRTLFVLVVALFVVVASVARADVGPRPSCPPGTYHTYMMGHKCVPNGSHLERDPEGGVKIVKDGEIAQPERKPSLPVATPSAYAAGVNDPLIPSGFPSPPVPVTSAKADPALPAPVAPAPVALPPEPAANPAPSSPPPQRGCTCGVPGAPEERIGFGLVIAAMLFAVSRRIRFGRSAH